MKSTKVIYTFNEFQQILKKEHSKGHKVGTIFESDRMYRYKITYFDRLNLLETMCDVTAYAFVLDYRNWVGMTDDFIKHGYTVMGTDDVDYVLENRVGTVDYIFIMAEEFKDKNYILPIAYELATTCPYLAKINTTQFIKGVYAVSADLSLCTQEKFDVNVACPWKLPYNIVVKHVLNRFGIKCVFPGFTEEDILNKTDPVPYNPHNYDIDYYNYKID